MPLITNSFQLIENKRLNKPKSSKTTKIFPNFITLSNIHLKMNKLDEYNWVRRVVSKLILSTTNQQFS